MATRWEIVARMIQCGTHSGIPPCCIAYYVTVWDVERDLLPRPEPVNYVQCPRCLRERRVVPISPCACTLARWFDREMAR